MAAASAKNVDVVEQGLLHSRSRRQLPDPKAPDDSCELELDQTTTALAQEGPGHFQPLLPFV